MKILNLQVGMMHRLFLMSMNHYLMPGLLTSFSRFLNRGALFWKLFVLVYFLKVKTAPKSVLLVDPIVLSLRQNFSL